MVCAYSVDLMDRVLRCVLSGLSRHKAAKIFGVSATFVIKLMTTYNHSGSVTPLRVGGRRFSEIDPHTDFLVQQIQERPDTTMTELAAELAERGTFVAAASISRWHIRNGYSYKKNFGRQRKDTP